MAAREKLMRVEENLLMVDGSDNEEDVIGLFDEDEGKGDEDLHLDQDLQSGFVFQPGFLDDVELPLDKEVDLEDSDTSRSRASEEHSGVSSRASSSLGIDLDLDLNIDDEFELDEVEADYMYEWNKDLANFPLVPLFTGNSGLQFEVTKEKCTPLSIFSKFITKQTITQFKSETNKYATSLIQQKERSSAILSKRSIFKTRKCVHIDELYKLLAILLHIELVKKSTFLQYWSTDITVHTSFAPKVMTRSRFLSILSFFHLNDNAKFIPRGEPNHDPLHKVRPFLDHLRQAFPSFYLPTQNICIDEALCPWRSRAQMRVYMKDKPVKWGIKLYKLCESKSGYVVEFEVMAHEINVSNTPEEVCKRLIAKYLNQGHCLYIDNYYCNPSLCNFLAANNTIFVGTVRPNRVGLPKDLMTQTLTAGEMDYRRRN
ncbi:PiggyBac transposable element-derived protein 4-like [Elysia marginata]|uniref:PiggyBac transposable element-derived protein 4-like n=1 Tax=Elysia marginata TaxID=1093978 RepID=A0AAV4EM47_9GAST|nr:PiggyBac transposable element-derived protein 4-like [Elysia marginata]